MRQRSRGLNDGLREARDDAIAGGADGVLILPIDLPRGQRRGHRRRARERRPRTARHSSRSSPIGTAEGRTRCCSPRPTSSTSSSAATATTRTPQLRRRPAPGSSSWTGRSSLDIDTPDDLLLAEAAGELPAADRAAGVDRWLTASRRSRSRASAEIVPGDDLPALIADALDGDRSRCRCATTTSSSSPRRSCRRPRARWST